MVKGELSLPDDQRASILPPFRKWNEVGWCRQLDLEVEVLLEARYLAENLVAIRDGAYRLARARGGPLETDEAADQSVVRRVRCVTLLVGETCVELVLGGRNWRGDLNAYGAQAWCAN